MKICIVTLGCKVNKYESDSLKKSLKLMGHEVVDSLEKADAYIINSCAVTSEAEKKSRQTVAKCLKFNKNADIYVMGCASQNNPEVFLSKKVKYVCGTSGKMNIINDLNQSGKHVLRFSNVYEDNMVADQSRTRAYIKIQDGCNNFCSYCLIPYLRGRSRSRNIVSIINEVGLLSPDIKEIVLVGINLTDYKIDGVSALLSLIIKLDDYGKRIRLGSIEESIISKDFLIGLTKVKNFCPHFHLSLQSGSDAVLKRMNRHYNRTEFIETCKLIYEVFPKASITTDIIVGFPGETEEEFMDTYNLAKEVNFSQMHIFPYSKREGTVASRLKEVPPEVKHERLKKLEELNKQLKTKFIHKSTYGNVLFEEKEGKFYKGHTENYLLCYVKSKEDLTNQIKRVRILKPMLDGAKAKISKKENGKNN